MSSAIHISREHIMKRLPLLLMVGSVVIPAICLGCQKEPGSNNDVQQASQEPRSPLGGRLQDDGRAPVLASHIKGQKGGGNEAIDLQDGKKEPLERKIVLTADIQLTVVDFAKAEQELVRLIQTVNGFAAKSDVAGAAGGSQTGTWKIRVPVPKFTEFQAAVKKLGDVVRYTSDAQDVSEEYYDLTNRIKSKEDELAAMRRLFDKASGKIEEVLAVQREVSRAQSELEQMKGRQRVLENLINLTTVTVRLQERGTYQPTEPPTFGTTVEGTFFGSINALIGLGKVLVIAAVALAPWLPLLAVAGVTIWLIVRRVGRSSPVATATEVPKTS
jgi:hypothetical protein